MQEAVLNSTYYQVVDYLSVTIKYFLYQPSLVRNTSKLATDVDECVNGNNNCDENADCTNTEGSFICMCSSGFSGNGTSCNGTLEHGIVMYV